MQRIIRWIIRHTICGVFGHNTHEAAAPNVRDYRRCRENCGPKEDPTTMTVARYAAIMEGTEALSIKEEQAGWHFCDAWDGLLIGPCMDEQDACLCLPERAKTNEQASGNNLYPMPKDLIGGYYNGGGTDPCDMLEGPCACGAWHHLYEWDEQFLKSYVYPQMSPEDRVSARVQRTLSGVAAEKRYGSRAIGYRMP